MTLSADILNQRSPYKLSQLGEFTFRFVTDQNIHYTVGFGITLERLSCLPRNASSATCHYE